MSTHARVAKRLSVALALSLCASACDSGSPSRAASGVSQQSTAAAHSDGSLKRPSFVKAPPDGEVADLVSAEAARARSAGERLVVYVGATWCEPCQRFHDAVESGALDSDLGAIRFFEFDLDRDRERLAAAGYASRLVPLFVAPDESGRASSQRVEGAIKGDGAVAFLVPKLRALAKN